jgi:S-adenosylmethionine-diacylglycerol 3-amino-3-carboxypropyl transferase
MHKNQLSEKIFSQIHGGNLVYNTCWEDPRCDREMLDINAQSQVVMLTSAGCNALDYLLDDPAQIHCVDMNPRQNALLQFKKAMFQGGDHEALFEFFGNGYSKYYQNIYEEAVAPNLEDEFALRYWKKNNRFFSGKGPRPSFYWHGSSGTVAWFIRQWLKSRPKLQRRLHHFFDAPTLEVQQRQYETIEPSIFNPFFRWLVKQHFIQSMLGVPKSQQALAAMRYSDGICGYVRDCFRHVFTRLPLQDNYFWKLYFLGQYTPECCPNYLQKNNFDYLKRRTGRIQTHTKTLNDFLEYNPGSYTHFVLLDHQDWLAAHQREALEHEWNLILKNSAPGAKILLRSAAFNVDFIPDFVFQKVHFDHNLAKNTQQKDRVGTYASTLIGTYTG